MAKIGMKVVGLLAAAVLWVVDALTATAKADPLWRKHHGLE